jgi:hypothetical protein
MKVSSVERCFDTAAPTQQRLVTFFAAASAARTEDQCRTVRKEAVNLLQRKAIAIADYVSLFGGQACHLLTRSPSGCFKYSDSGVDASAIACLYSRAKHGSVVDLELLVRALVATFLGQLDAPGSLRSTFEQAKACGDYVVLFGTGLRNVPAASNIMCEMFVQEANMALVLRGYPTIANVRLARIAPPCDNYANLSLEERVEISLVQDHVLPDANFYHGNAVHVLFVDDVLVTGATADKVYVSAMAHGARSFHAIYPVVIDPVVALREPEVEDSLNTYLVGDDVDEVLQGILEGPGYVPVLRTLRLVFSQQHHQRFAEMMSRLGTDPVRKLYRAAVSADFSGKTKYAQSLAAARDYLDLQP